MRAKIVILIFISGFYSLCFAQAVPNAGRIMRSEEMLQEDKILRAKIEKEEKFFIENITVIGSKLLTEGRIKEITSPYEDRWLTKAEIREILEAIRQAYKEKGIQEKAVKVSSRIKDKNLEVKVEELSPWNH